MVNGNHKKIKKDFFIGFIEENEQMRTSLKPLKPLFSFIQSQRVAFQTFMEKSYLQRSYNFDNNKISRFLGLGVAFLRSRIVTKNPFFLAHSITYVCNSQCKTCTQWHMSNIANRDMNTETIFSMLENAYIAGVRGYYIFGGEPLLRRDINKILQFAKQRGFVTTLNTNGSLLEKKAESISNYLDFIFVSLDYPNEYNDFIRGRKGAFREVVNGIKKMVQLKKTRVVIVTTISKLNFDKIEEMAHLAQKLRVGISYNTVEPTFSSSYKEKREHYPVEKYGLTMDELKDFYSKLLSLKQKNYPLMETKKVLEDYSNEKNFKCHFPKIFIYVSPEGDFFPCFDHGHPSINLKKIDFQKYFASQEYRRHVIRSENCRICLRTCVRMYSYTYSLKPNHIINLIETSAKLVA